LGRRLDRISIRARHSTKLARTFMDQPEQPAIRYEVVGDPRLIEGARIGARDPVRAAQLGLACLALTGERGNVGAGGRPRSIALIGPRASFALPGCPAWEPAHFHYPAKGAFGAGLVGRAFLLSEAERSAIAQHHEAHPRFTSEATAPAVILTISLACKRASRASVGPRFSFCLRSGTRKALPPLCFTPGLI